MRVMTSSAPKFAIAVLGANAERQLLGMTDDFDISARRLGRNKGCECVFESPTRDEVSQPFARIRNASLSRQMTLLTDTVSCGAGQFSGIDNGSANRLSQMLIRRSVTAITGDTFSGKRAGLISVECVWYRFRLPRMAQQTGNRNRSRKVRVWIHFVSRRNAPRLGLSVIADRRLEKMIANSHQVSKGVTARADYISDALF